MADRERWLAQAVETLEVPEDLEWLATAAERADPEPSSQELSLFQMSRCHFHEPSASRFQTTT